MNNSVSAGLEPTRTEPSPAAPAPQGPEAPDRSRDRWRAIAVCQIVSTFSPVVGGVQQVTLGLCGRLAERGLDVTVLTRRVPGTRRFERISSIPVYRLGLPLNNRLGAFSFAIEALWMLAIRLRHCRLVHVQNIDTPLLVGLVAKAALRRCLVATIHGESKIDTQRGRLLGPLRLALMRHGVDAFTALTPTMERELANLGVSASRIRTIPNGVDTERFRPPTSVEKRAAREALGIAPHATVGISVGRLVPLKRIDVLLRAWQSVGDPDDVLLIVGDGPERRRLEAMATASDGRAVRFLGSRTDVRDCLWASDFFVIPSESEGLSMAMLEGMATGLPVVATSLPGTSVIVSPSVNGLLVPPNEASALEEAMNRLMASEALRAEVGRRARETIERECDLVRMAERHVRLYSALLEDIRSERRVSRRRES